MQCWIAYLFPTEIANALAVAERAGRIKPGEAALFFSDILKSSPVLRPANPLLPRAIDICLQINESVYDCLYVALAERETCDLVTADDKLVNNLQARRPNAEVIMWPEGLARLRNWPDVPGWTIQD